MIVRKSAARVLVAALLVAVALPFSAPAGAASLGGKDAFVADSAGRALRISALGQDPITIGFSQARISSTLAAKATGAGRLLSPATTSVAEVSADDAAQRVPQTGRQCAGPTGPLPPLLDIGIACSSAEVSVKDGLPLGKSTGSILGIDVNASSILTQILKPIEAPLKQVFGALPSQLDPAENTVADLLKELGVAQTVLVRVGDATSESSSTRDKIVTRATAAAGRVDILPNTVAFGEYFVRIEVGSAKAEAVHDRTTGGAAAVADPAIVRVLFAKNLAGQTIPPIVIAPGASQTILAGTPLETTITAGTAKKFNLADGSVGSVADAVSVHLLKGVSNGVNLQLGHAEAVVAGTPLRVTKDANPKSVPVGNSFITTITIENPFECEVQNVRVDDVLSVADGARFRITGTSPKAEQVPEGSNLESGTVIWRNIGTIAPKGSKQVTLTTLAQGQQSGAIIDIATATGTLGNCPSVDKGTDVAAAALNQVPVSAVARLEVPVQLPRTGASSQTTTFVGFGLMGLAVLGYVVSRRMRAARA